VIITPIWQSAPADFCQIVKNNSQNDKTTELQVAYIYMLDALAGEGAHAEAMDGLSPI